METSLCEGRHLILSDLHIGHQASAVRGIDALEPLFSSGHTLIFNGDTFEMRRPADREKAIIFSEQLQRRLEETGTRAIFITGNHDPAFGEINHLECAKSGILITHGDILFDNIAPWSLNEKNYRRAHETELAQLNPLEKKDLVVRLAALRRATRNYEISHKTIRPGLSGTLLHFFETTWPPWRPLSIVQSWMEVPSRAEKFIQTYRPGVRTLIIGHSHFAGVWQRNDLRVINTGAAMTGFRPRVVEIEQGQITIRRLRWRENRLELDSTLASFPI